MTIKHWVYAKYNIKKINCLKDYKNSKSKSYILKNSNSHMDIILLAQLKNEKIKTLYTCGLSDLQVHVIHTVSKPETGNQQLNNILGFKIY